MDYDIDLSGIFEKHPWLEAVFGPITEIFGSKLQYYWIAVAAIIIIGFYLIVHRKYGSDKPFWSFSFPKHVYLHRSSKLDYATFLLYTPMAVLAAWLASPYLSKAEDLADSVFAYFYSSNYPYYTTEHPLLMAAAVFGGIAWTDLSQFITHVAYHRIPWLWEFHKVHHSAEVLTPFTTLRDHPVIFIIDFLFYTFFLGIYIGVAYYFLPGVAESYFLWEASVYAFAFGVFFFLTSHYFVPISFGIFDKILVSPAYHSVHHIAEAKYYNKNYGHIFSFWDALLGTAYHPTAKDLENATYGVEDQENYQSLGDFYLRPFGLKRSSHGETR